MLCVRSEVRSSAESQIRKHEDDEEDKRTGHGLESNERPRLRNHIDINAEDVAAMCYGAGRISSPHVYETQGVDLI